MNRNIETRAKEGATTALVGLFLNLVLGGAKLAAGLLSGSVSITSDAVNSISDAGVSAVAVGSFALSKKKADREHPYGHGRYEYIAAFLISAIIVAVGVDLVVSSVRRIISGEGTRFSLLALVILIVSAATKLFMAVYYRARNVRVKSDTLRAASFDSFSDCAITTLVTVAFCVSRVTDFPVDGVCGVAAAGFIVFGGIKIILSTMDKLLGAKCDGEVEQAITKLICADPLVMGVHDLRVHDYGVGHKVASADAEFDRRLSFSEVHSAVDKIERAVYRELGINLVVHSDPVDNTDPRYVAVRHAIITALEPYSREASFHELFLDDDGKKVRLHLRLSEKLMKERDHILGEVMEAVAEFSSGYTVEAEYDFM